MCQTCTGILYKPLLLTIYNKSKVKVIFIKLQMSSADHGHSNPSQPNQNITKYQQKLSVLYTQSAQFTVQLKKLQQIIQKNQETITKQNNFIKQLSQKVSQIQTRTDIKINILNKQLQNFKGYYEQTYTYTVTRITQLQQNMHKYIKILQQQLSKFSNIYPVQYIKYVHQLIISIITNYTIKNSQLKQYVNNELYQLQIEVSKFKQYAVTVQEIVDQFRIIKYGNQSLKEAVQINRQIFQNFNNNSNQQNTSSSNSNSGQINTSLSTSINISNKIIKFYEPKFKQILKKINSYSMQIQMVKLLITSHNNKNNNNIQTQLQQQYERKAKQQHKLYQKKIKQLQQTISADKKLCQKQINKKDQILKKRHDKILELQQTIQQYMQKYLTIQKQVNQLKIANHQYIQQIKLLKVRRQKIAVEQNQRIKIQHKKLQVQGKLLIVEVQYENLQKKYYSQQEQLNAIKKSLKNNENQISMKLSKSQKVLNFQQKRTKAQHSPNKLLKINDPKTLTNTVDTVYKSSINSYTNKNSQITVNQNIDIDYLYLQKQNQKLSKTNKQLQKINKQLQQQIHRLLIDKQKQNKQDQQYLDHIQAQVQKNNKQIQRLQNINIQLTRQIYALQQINQKLQIQAQQRQIDFESVSKNFNNIVYQLQRKIEVLENRRQKLEDKMTNYDQYQKPSSTKKYLSDKSSPLSSILSRNISNDCQDKNSNRIQQRNRKKSTKFLIQLQDAILSMNLSIPIICNIDKNGYIRQQKTGHYLVDQYKKPMHLSKDELTLALESGLLLI